MSKPLLAISIHLTETTRPDPECQCSPQRCVLFDGGVACTLSDGLHPQYYNMLGQVLMQLIQLDQQTQVSPLSHFEWHEVLEAALNRILED